MVEEKILTLNLRKNLLKVPKWERNKKAVRILKRKLKVDKIKIDNRLNEKIFSCPSEKIRIKMIRLDDESVRVELIE